MKDKIIYMCKVNGSLGRVGKMFAMCSKVGVGGSESRCHAHGNAKCKHKERKVING